MSLILRPYQEEAVSGTLAMLDGGLDPIVSMPTGTGKCFGVDTPVMMLDGTIRAVQDVVVGDRLMGPDSSARVVASLARGREMLYRVTPTKGDSYVVNESHILSVKVTPESAGKQHRIVNLTVEEYMRSSDWFKHIAKGWRSGVNFGSALVPFDPYFVGLWIGDGSRESPEISKPDPEVLECVKEVADSWGLRVSTSVSGTCPTHSIVGGSRWSRNPLTVAMRSFGLIPDKRLPQCYKSNSRQVRLSVLAGLMDSDGHATCGGFDFISVDLHIAEDVAFLARSLGLAAYIRKCSKSCQGGFTGQYHRVSISGDCSIIPNRIPRKKLPPRSQKKDVLVTGINLEKIGVGDYYGFELSGPDKLFLLGDFTVVHNTPCEAVVAHKSAERTEKRVLFLTHRGELLDQIDKWLARVDPKHPPGREQAGSRSDRRGAKPRYVCAMVQSISRKDRLLDFDPKDFGLVITDEGHHSAAATYQRVQNHFRGNKACRFAGFSATWVNGKGEGNGLACGYNATAYRMKLIEAIQEGWILRPRSWPIRVTGIDWGTVKANAAGIYDEKALDTVLMGEQVFHQLTLAVQERARDMQTLIYGPSKKWVKAAYEVFHRYEGPNVRQITDDIKDEDERAAVFRDFRAGLYRKLVNCSIACLDSETEILTSSGWVGKDAISFDHKIANWKDGEIFFDHPLAIEHRARRPGETMVSHKTNRMSFRVTGDHRVLYRTLNDGRYIEARASHLVGKKFQMPICGVAKPQQVAVDQDSSCRMSRSRAVASRAYGIRSRDESISYEESIAIASLRVDEARSLKKKSPHELTADECAFIGFWIGDGTKTSLQSGGVEYKLFQGVNCPAVVEWIDTLIQRLGYDCVRRVKQSKSEDFRRPFVSWSLSRGTGSGSQKRRGLYGIEPYLEKDGTSLLWGLSGEQYAALIGGFWMADGSHGNASEPRESPWRINNTNKPVLDLLQAIGVCRGFRCSMRASDANKKRNPRAKTLYSLCVSRKSFYATGVETPVMEMEWIDEEVWCVKSHTSWIVARRDGIVFVTGNTEGTDLPNARCAAICRPCQSEVLLAQIVGRVLRPLDGLLDHQDHRDRLWHDAGERLKAIAASDKPFSTVLDFSSAGARKLLTTADLLGCDLPKPVVDYANRIMENEEAPEGGHDGVEVLDRAEAEWALIQEEVERRSRIKAVGIKYETREVDLFDPRCMAAEPERTRTVKQNELASPAQVDYICDWTGWERDKIRHYSKYQASGVISKIKAGKIKRKEPVYG